MLGDQIFAQANALNIPCHFENEISSTNDLAKDLKLGEEFLVTCNYQTKGRGRFERTWIDSNQNGQIFLSYVKQLDKAPHFLLPSLAGLALRRCLQQEFPSESPYQLKFPNDILLNDKKVSGILCEMKQMADKFTVIIGMGINLFSFPELAGAGSIIDHETNLKNTFVQKLVANLRQIDFALNKLQTRDELLQDAVLQAGEAVVEISPDFEFVSKNRRISWREL